MSTRLKDLREKRGRIVTDMRGLLDAAGGEGRDLTAEEQERYDALFADQERLGEQISREERQQALDRRMAEEAARSEQAPDHPAPESREDRANPTPDGAYRAAFARFLRGGTGALAGEELRALQAGADVDGGYLVPPQQFVTELIKAVDDQVVMRGLARTFQVPQAASLGAPSLDADPADPADADWTTELATGSEDTAMKLGKRELRPHPLAKRIKVSQQLLRQALIGPEALVMGRLAYKFAVTQEKAFLTGSGAGRPLGVFTASDNDISTARDVATGNTATAIGFDGLIEAKFALKGQYWPRARWIFHRDAVKQITRLKDGEGQYIWRQSVREGESDTLLGLPMTLSEWAPNTFTTGLYVGLLGDFQHYWIVDALSMQVQRLNELYAETNQVGFIGRLETDGAPVLEEAFVRVTLA